MYLKWAPNRATCIHIWLMATLQVACVLASRHHGSAPFKTSFVLSRDYATRRSAALVSLPLLANQPEDLMMDEENLDSASDELTTRELAYLRRNSQPVAWSTERRDAGDISSRAPAESSELATIEVEDPMTSSSAESSSTSVSTPAATTAAPSTTATPIITTSQPTTTTTTTTFKPTSITTGNPQESSSAKLETASVTMKPVQTETANTINAAISTTHQITSTLSTTIKTEPVVTTTLPPIFINVTQAITTSTQSTSTTTDSNPQTTKSSVADNITDQKNVTFSETTQTKESLPATAAVPVTTTIEPLVTTEVNRRGRMCDLSRAVDGCNFQVAEVPVLESLLDTNRTSSNNTRVVNEFVIVPNDGPLTFDESAYPVRLANETDLKAEHRTVDGDEVEVDYVNSEADTTTKVDIDVSKIHTTTTPASSTSRSPTTTTTTTTLPTVKLQSTTTTSTTTTPAPSSTTLPSTSTSRSSFISITSLSQRKQLPPSTTQPPTTSRPISQTSRINQKLLRLTDAPTTSLSSTRHSVSISPITSVSSSLSRQNPARLSTSQRSSSHRLFFNEPESEPRRRHKYASIAADEEEMKILTRYPVISQLSRLSSSTRSSGSNLQRTVTQSPVTQLLTNKQAIELNHKDIVDSEALLRRQANTKITTSRSLSTSTVTPPITSTTLKTTPKVSTTTSSTTTTTTTTTTRKPTTTTSQPSTTTTSTTTTVSPSTPAATTTTSASRFEPTKGEVNFEERLTLIAVSGSEKKSNKTSAPPSSPLPIQPVAPIERKKSTLQVANVKEPQENKNIGERLLKGSGEFSGEFELGSIEDQLAKDALHQRKSKVEDSGRIRTNKYSNRQRAANQQQQVAASIDTGLWLPSAADELSLLSSAVGGGSDDSSGSSSDLLPGRPGIDYPVHADIPRTSFDCRNYEQSGFYADVESGCQAYHSCHRGRGGRHTFMCPNGTLFSQELLTCDWWYNVECSSSKLYYGGDGTYNPAAELGLEQLA